MESKPQSAALIATTVVVNIIWWMVMIAAIGLGATHLHQCPVQCFIPIYLLVMGASSISSLFVTYIRSGFQEGAVFVLISVIMSLLHIFTFCWFIAGTYWIYSVYPPDYSPGTDRYCHKITYQFGFVVTTIVWVTMALVFVCGFCVTLLTCCGTITARRHLIPSRTSFYGTIGDQPPAAGDV